MDQSTIVIGVLFIVLTVVPIWLLVRAGKK